MLLNYDLQFCYIDIHHNYADKAYCKMEKACVDVFEGHNKNGLTCLRLCIIVSVNANDIVFHLFI